MTRRVVVVGASLAGATAATTLRALGFSGTVDLIGAEPDLPYERPALSKTFLTGTGRSDHLLLNPAAEYGSLDIALHLGTPAVALDVARRVVSTSDGTAIEYDDLVIATGSVNRRPDIAGMDLQGVHQLRSLADAEALHSDAEQASSAVIVGQGFIGCEVAASLRTRGLTVTMVDPQPGPLHGPLGPDVSARVAAWHRSNGVTLINDVGIAELTGRDHVDGVLLDDGTALPAELVVVGVGARPASDWLDDSGLRTDRGAVLVDSDGRSSSDGVYAAGDVSAWWDAELGEHRRVEHYDAALLQGQRVAHAIMGSTAGPRGRTWFWSDQYEHTLHYSGAHQPDDDLHWRGSTGFWLRQGTVTAAVSLDDGRTFRRAIPLIGHQQNIGVLLDGGTDLRTLHTSAQPVPAGT